MLTCSARGLAMSEPLTNCRVTGGGHFAHFMHEWKVVGPLTRKPLHKRGVEVVWIEVVDVVSDEKGEFAIVELELVDGKLVTDLPIGPRICSSTLTMGTQRSLRRGSGAYSLNRATS